MKTQTIIQDYYGASNFIESNNDKELTIFIIDDNIIYRQLMKKTIDRPNFSVLTFSTGEESLEYMHLSPDLVLLDYHLDGVNPYAKKGDVIYTLIKQKSPTSEIYMISSDEKFKWLSKLNLKQQNKLLYKDCFIYKKIKSNVLSYLDTRGKETSYKTFKNLAIIGFFIGIITLYTMLFLI